MKKLLFLFCSILLVSCNSNQTQAEVVDIYKDYWFFKDKENAIKANSLDGFYVKFIDSTNVEEGWIEWERDKDFSRDVEDDDRTFIGFNEQEMLLTDWNNNLYSVLVEDFNTIKVNIPDTPDTSRFWGDIEELILVRIPHFFPKKPTDYLKEKKEELDLGLISKSDYKNILERTKKYIEY